MAVVRLSRSECQLVVVDIQERLLPHINQHECVVEQSVKMLQAAAVLDVPVLLSEQYRAKLGPTAKPIRDAISAATEIEKMAFSVCRDATAGEAILKRGRSQVLLLGIETHVCVQQTALDLLARGMTPVVLADAVSSRRRLDREIAIERMRSAGAVITTVESAIFELLELSGTDLFRRILPIVR
ncbi:MAG: hydrolase [Planctomycetes bacterium]|nr:hydrolase [Planctomycetota bacterium]